MTALAVDFIDKVRTRKVPDWGSFEHVLNGQLHVFRHAHPNMWVWKVEAKMPMPGFLEITRVL